MKANNNKDKVVVRFDYKKTHILDSSIINTYLLVENGTTQSQLSCKLSTKVISMKFPRSYHKVTMKLPHILSYKDSYKY
jgi:hypothetical protein